MATGLNNYALSKVQASIISALSGLTTVTTIITGVLFNNEVFILVSYCRNNSYFNRNYRYELCFIKETFAVDLLLCYNKCEVSVYEEYKLRTQRT